MTLTPLAVACVNYLEPHGSVDGAASNGLNGHRRGARSARPFAPERTSVAVARPALPPLLLVASSQFSLGTPAAPSLSASGVVHRRRPGPRGKEEQPRPPPWVVGVPARSGHPPCQVERAHWEKPQMAAERGRDEGGTQGGRGRDEGGRGGGGARRERQPLLRPHSRLPFSTHCFAMGTNPKLLCKAAASIPRALPGRERPCDHEITESCHLPGPAPPPLPPTPPPPPSAASAAAPPTPTLPSIL